MGLVAVSFYLRQVTSSTTSTFSHKQKIYAKCDGPSHQQDTFKNRKLCLILALEQSHSLVSAISIDENTTLRSENTEATLLIYISTTLVIK